MAITLKYGAPGPAILASYAAGVGQRQQRQEQSGLRAYQQMAQQAAQMKYGAWQAALDRQSREGMQGAALTQAATLQTNLLTHQESMAGAARAFEAGQGLAERGWRTGEREASQTFTADQTYAGREYQSGQSALDRQARSNAAALEDLRAGRVELAPAAERDLARIDESEATMESDPRWDQQQKDQARQQFEARRRALLSTAKQPVKQQLTPAEAYSQSTVVVDPKTGQPLPPGSTQPGTVVHMGPRGPTVLELDKPARDAAAAKATADAAAAAKRTEMVIAAEATAIRNENSMRIAVDKQTGKPAYTEAQIEKAAEAERAHITSLRQWAVSGGLFPEKPAPSASPDAPGAGGAAPAGTGGTNRRFTYEPGTDQLTPR